MGLFLYWIGAFFLGSIPNAYFAGRLLRGIDIRQHGSGNVGATNVFRVLGKGPGIVVFALDFLKGWLPAFFFGHFFPQAAEPELLGLLSGLFAVFGHMFTPFLNFKGGKGIASGAGALCGIFPVLFLISLAAWVSVFFISRIVSLSSLVAVLTLLISGVITGQKGVICGLFSAMTLLVFWSHRGNIDRLARGTEHKFDKRPNA